MGGKEGGRGGWPFESFPARTCVDEVLPQKNLHVMLAAAAEESGHLLFLTFFSQDTTFGQWGGLVELLHSLIDTWITFSAGKQ